MTPHKSQLNQLSIKKSSQRATSFRQKDILDFIRQPSEMELIDKEDQIMTGD